MNQTPLEMWKNLVLFLYSTKGQNPTAYDIKGPCIWTNFELGLSQIGYRNEGRIKRKRWYDIYISEEEVLKFNRIVQEIIKKKKDFVACFRFGAKPKRTSNKVGDFCLIAATYVFKSGKLKKVNIFYRTTEVVTKFLADLILLRDLFKGDLNFVDHEGVRVEFFFTKVYTRYFHLLNFYRICKSEFGLDVRALIGKWATDFIDNVIKKKKIFKFMAAKRIARKFLEDEYEET